MWLEFDEYAATTICFQRAQRDRLLGYLSKGLHAFCTDLAAHGLDRRVRAMTMPLFVIGGTVKGGVYGDHPSLTELDENGDLLHAIDFRSVYATVVERWLGHSAAGSIAGDYQSVAFL